MKFFNTIVFCFLFSVFQLSAQDSLSVNESFDAHDYCKARTMYAEILKNKPYDSKLNFRYGVCLFEIGEFAKAVKPLEFASKKIPQAYLYLGDLKMKEYKFLEALNLYNTGYSQLQPMEQGVLQFQQKIGMVAKAQNMLSAIEELEIVDSVFAAKKDFFSHYELGAESGELYLQRAALDSVIGVPLTGFMTERKDRKIFADTVSGSTDLFILNKYLDGWSAKQALSATVNTAGNENFPFLRQDGISLYFCSDGPNSIGGYDIFLTRANPEGNGYYMPQNIGMPFNSPFNDYLLVVDEEQSIGWFATDRYQAKDSVVIYKFKYNRTHDYVSVGTQEDLLKYAQLKSYNTARVLVEDIDDTQLSPMETKVLDADSMLFVINDTTVYRSISEFKSDYAKASYLKALEYDLRTKALKQDLIEKRKQYSAAKDDQKKELLMFEIVGKEQELRKIETEPNPFYLDARNLENKKLIDVQSLSGRYDF